jgi:hypothetical protein
MLVEGILHQLGKGETVLYQGAVGGQLEQLEVRGFQRVMEEGQFEGLSG